MYNLNSMIKTTTHSDLLKYAYNETGMSDSDRLQRSIDGDPVVADDFTEIVSVMNLLDEAVPEVNPSIVEKILKACL